MPIILYNTLTRETVPFKPLKRRAVSLYTCGPTVYNFAHIGNLRTYIFEDILKRVLLYNGYRVKHVMNITDVGHLTSDADTGEDKMEKGAKREGKTAWDIAAFYTKAFLKDMALLNILRATIYPRATDHIPEQIRLIRRLEKNGYTYQTADGIYFDTRKFVGYGRLARLKPDELKAGARVALGEKRSLTDFALWKFSPPLEQRQMEWPSPWGVGFPGWHIECSAMATKYLGQPFDIHCGGIDHIPVHHTNEIAQSEAAYNEPLANVWMHGEFLLIGSDKMAKSGENFLTLQSIKDRKMNPLAYRYFLLQTHYRKPLSFSWEALQAAENGLNHLYSAARSLKATTETKNSSPVKDAFLSAVSTDLDLPAAVALLWTALKEKTIDQKTLLEFDKVLGLQIKEHLAAPAMAAVPEAITKMIFDRDAARRAKNWAESDRLRTELEKEGYLVKDTPTGTEVEKK